MRCPALVLALLFATAGCDHAIPTTAMAPNRLDLRAPTPDEGFRLSPAERSRVLPDFDAAALERLLAMVKPEMRNEVLRYFQPRDERGEPRGHLVQLHDPRLQAVLEEVWAPFWDNASDQALDENLYGMPGREAARRRREARDRERERGGQP